MVNIGFLIERFQTASEKVALVDGETTITFGELCAEIQLQIIRLAKAGIKGGEPVVLLGDYSRQTISLFLALVELECILIPLTPNIYNSLKNSLPIVSPRWQIDSTSPEILITHLAPDKAESDLYQKLQARHVPGLVMFTSGSSGVPKAVVHDFSKLLEKFKTTRPAMITINFLLFDHWGGLNTLLHALSNACKIVFPTGRTPESICTLVEKHRIELLPATPSFLNLLLISGAFKNYDLSSLKVISYGAEPMPISTLNGIRKVFPNVELRQTYGMIELGVLRAKTRTPDSLWVKVGGAGYDLRVVDGVLQIKADSAMLGYINEPSPFTDDGYLITGDLVEQDGEWIKILGRKSDLINVGGQKVYPSEVEAVILSLSSVIDAVVYGEAHPLMGKIVCADVIVSKTAIPAEIRKQIIQVCKNKLQAFMVPMKINFVSDSLQSERLKRVRSKR
jgi:long-chain acyl-CoA synthetase